MEEEAFSQMNDELKVKYDQLKDKLGAFAQKFQNLDDAEKKEFVQGIPSMLLKPHLAAFTKNMMIYFVIAVTVVVFLLAFFGYKLYNSELMRERKREQKKILKDQKKKDKKKQ